MSDETTTAIATVAAPTQMTFEQTERLAVSFAKSRMFVDGDDDYETTVAKIFTRIMYGMEIGLPPVAACINVNVIKGRPALGSGGIAAKIMGSGIVRFHEVERTNDVCTLDWFRANKKVGRSSFSMEDANRAGLVKGGYSCMYTKYPRNMLFARALTEGQRVYCPDLFNGSMYTPEELGQSEVVEVTQPDRPAQDRDKERTAARNNLVEVIGRCTTNRDERVRVYKTVLKKCDKGDKQMTTAEYREYAGMVKAFHEDGNLTEWCDTFGPALVQEAEVVDAEVVEPNADDKEEWKRANGMFHAELTTFLKAGNHETKGDEYKIIKDMVRAECGLAFDAEWSEVSAEQMRMSAKIIAAQNGDFVKVGIAGKWQTLARERGAIDDVPM